jgi:hypothetical protein
MVLNSNTYNIDANEESRAGKKEVITSARWLNNNFTILNIPRRAAICSGASPS